MEFFSIEYRDPIFGVIILFALIFIISFMNFWWGIFKSKEEKNKIERFIKKFEITKDEDEYKNLLDDFSIPPRTLALLSHAYQKGGDYEKAINIYLLALKKVEERDEKEYLLYNLGKTYYKAGFLRRSLDMFLEALKLNPRNQKALKYLTVIYEQLKEFDRALEVIDVLEELEVSVSEQKIYLKARMIENDNTLKDEQKIEKLKKLSKEFVLIERLIFEFMLKNFSHVEYKKVKEFKAEPVMDLLWYLEDVNEVEDGFAKELFGAKGLLEGEDKSEVFEFEVLSKLNSLGYKKATLSFSYLCGSCKNSYPVFFYRCPSCQELGKIVVEPILSAISYENEMAF